MEKRKLSAIPRAKATPDMMDVAGRLKNMDYIVTAELIENETILLLYFYGIKELIEGKTEAKFRTFLSKDDYITQDLMSQKVRWKTASFSMMDNLLLWSVHWNEKKKGHDYKEVLFLRTDEEKEIILDFFKEYDTKTRGIVPWNRVIAFQEAVKARKLDERHKKEVAVIDKAMEPIKEAPAEFFNWVWEHGMSFSRYLIYKEEKRGTVKCECTHCKMSGVLDRKEIRLRNNEKGICPFCGNRVTIKAKGRMPGRIRDERWFLYVDPTQDGFVLRYFKASRNIRSDSYTSALINKCRVEQHADEYSRSIYTFPKGKPEYVSYEWRVYKQRGLPRWCPDNGNIDCMECILYPGNLPQAWEHTPMKYSALEVMSANIPTVSVAYEYAMQKYLDFPKMEWICKMGLNNLARDIINKKVYYYQMRGNINYNGKSIFEILGLTKVNTRVLQAVDGNHYVLRLLQVSQQIGLQFKAEQLQEYYETFGCNTELLKQANRKVSLHRLVKYIAKESERYPLGDKGECYQYSYMRYKERKDPRIERKQNMAEDWLEYLKWCKELNYDTDNMFIYMPKNFKAVHDRTAQEYQVLQDKKAAEEKRRKEAEAERAMRETQKALTEILEQNNGTDAFLIKGKGLILMVPKNGDEIRAEGSYLHHCVGGYVEKVAKGETSIFFVRKADSPDVPYFTLEWKNNDIVQCRGLHNCGMPPEVKAFTQAFKKKMLDSIKKDKKKIQKSKTG